MPGPEPLANALAELIAKRGFARVRSRGQLQETWREVAGERIAKHTKAVEIRRGVLHVAVANAPMLSELVSFHREELLEVLDGEHSQLRIKDLKFKLESTR